VDFSNRNVQSQDVAPGAQYPAAGSPGSNKSKKKSKVTGKLSRIGLVIGVAVVSLLLLTVIVLAIFGADSAKESKYVDESKLQAVFLNTGQVYFGNIKSINSKNLVLTNIYYLQTSGSSTTASTSANNNVTLVKLGCELHEPYDQMIINRDQVTFWENLQDNGKVATAVTTFKKQNPDGQKCADQSSSSSTNGVNSTQNAGSSSTTPAAATSTNP